MDLAGSLSLLRLDDDPRHDRLDDALSRYDQPMDSDDEEDALHQERAEAELEDRAFEVDGESQLTPHVLAGVPVIDEEGGDAPPLRPPPPKPVARDPLVGLIASMLGKEDRCTAEGRAVKDRATTAKKRIERQLLKLPPKPRDAARRSKFSRRFDGRHRLDGEEEAAAVDHRLSDWHTRFKATPTVGQSVRVAVPKFSVSQIKQQCRREKCAVDFDLKYQTALYYCPDVTDADAYNEHRELVTQQRLDRAKVIAEQIEDEWVKKMEEEELGTLIPKELSRRKMVFVQDAMRDLRTPTVSVVNELD